MGIQQFWALMMFLALFLAVTVVGVLLRRAERRRLRALERRLTDLGRRPVGQVVADRVASDIAERALQELGVDLTDRNRPRLPDPAIRPWRGRREWS
jgi:signal transduction histidine kinase